MFGAGMDNDITREVEETERQRANSLKEKAKEPKSEEKKEKKKKKGCFIL